MSESSIHKYLDFDFDLSDGRTRTSIDVNLSMSGLAPEVNRSWFVSENLDDKCVRTYCGDSRYTAAISDSAMSKVRATRARQWSV